MSQTNKSEIQGQDAKTEPLKGKARRMAAKQARAQASSIRLQPAAIHADSAEKEKGQARH